MNHRSSDTQLLLATRNPGKIREYTALLADLPLEVTSLDAQSIDLDVAETGTTFQENALLKAHTYARLSGLWTWADDSGLEVDALNGEPGVYSARYAGPGASDADRYRKLLSALGDLPSARRTARFRCVIAIVAPDGRSYTCSGSVEGLILREPVGDQGFGYDPIFWLPQFELSMAQLSPEQKNRISHRGKAAAAAKELLRELGL